MEQITNLILEKYESKQPKKKEGGEEKPTNLKKEQRIMSKRGEKTQMN